MVRFFGLSDFLDVYTNQLLHRSLSLQGPNSITRDTICQVTLHLPLNSDKLSIFGVVKDVSEHEPYMLTILFPPLSPEYQRALDEYVTELLQGKEPALRFTRPQTRQPDSFSSLNSVTYNPNRRKRSINPFRRSPYSLENATEYFNNIDTPKKPERSIINKYKNPHRGRHFAIPGAKEDPTFFERQDTRKEAFIPQEMKKTDPQEGIIDVDALDKILS